MADSDIPILPKKKSDRLANEKYIYQGKIRIWNGKVLKCAHNKFISRCLECGGNEICDHGRYKWACRDCGGSQICIHKKQKNQCRECGGNQLCQHGIEKRRCLECGGNEICEHNLVKKNCKECGGSQICIHKKQKFFCRICSTTGYCEHGRERRRCPECNGNDICEHNKVKRNCKICDPNGYVSNILRNRINIAIKEQKSTKNKSTLELLGCSIKEARAHLENQFIEGMSWINQGDWHIDHRKPCSSFDLTDIEEQKMCFHYSNLQPLWGEDNMSKSNSFDEESFEWKWSGEKWIEK